MHCIVTVSKAQAQGIHDATTLRKTCIIEVNGEIRRGKSPGNARYAQALRTVLSITKPRNRTQAGSTMSFQPSQSDIRGLLVKCLV